MFSHITSDQTAKLEELASTLSKSQKIIVVTGAGISTSCGIPDFRSQEGLYSLMGSAYQQRTQRRATKIKGADLFNANLFRDADQTATFYEFIAALREKTRAVTRTSAAHKLIRKLRDNGKLVRCYTQNIDGFEAKENLCNDMSRGAGNRKRTEKKAREIVRSPITTAPGGELDGGCEVVPLHGELSSVRCTICAHEKIWMKDEQTCFQQGTVPECPECLTQNEIRRCTGKRSIRVGTLRPNIVLYGEEHPSTDKITQIRQSDLACKPDLLLVMGTSLKVDGLKMLVREMAQAVHAKKDGKVFFINLTAPAASTWGGVFDAWVDMDCDSWIRKTANLRPEIWRTQTHLEDHPISRLKKTSSPVQQSATNKATTINRAPPASSSVKVMAPYNPAKSTSLRQNLRKRTSEEADIEIVTPNTKRKRADLTSQTGDKATVKSWEEDDEPINGTITSCPLQRPNGTNIRSRNARTPLSTRNPRRIPSAVQTQPQKDVEIYVDDTELDAISSRPTMLSSISDKETKASGRLQSVKPNRSADSATSLQISTRNPSSVEANSVRDMDTRYVQSDLRENRRKPTVLRPSQSRVAKPTAVPATKSRDVLPKVTEAVTTTLSTGAFRISRLSSRRDDHIFKGQKSTNKENMQRLVQGVSTRTARI